MISARFLYAGERCSGFIVSGHAGGKYGKDIVCSAVSSAVMLTVNTVTEYFIGNETDAVVRVRNNEVGILLKKENGQASKLLEALKLHLELLGGGKDAAGRIKISKVVR